MSQSVSTILPIRKPGRPKKVNSGYGVGPAEGNGCEERKWPPRTLPPRLLDLHAAATYLGVSPWTIRDLEAAGVLPRVRVPLPGGRELRKLLFDKADLDQLIKAWKEAA
jgi:hypothetical protein